ncbi:hypothetical protein FKM82_030772 [Ascaphus truei]
MPSMTLLPAALWPLRVQTQRMAQGNKEKWKLGRGFSGHENRGLGLKRPPDCGEGRTEERLKNEAKKKHVTLLQSNSCCVRGEREREREQG